VGDLLEACQRGQRIVLLGGFPIGLLVCGENNVLTNIQSQGNRAVLRHHGQGEVFLREKTRIVFNGAHDPMGNWGKLDRRFELLSAHERWAFYATNVRTNWGRSILRAYFDGHLIATTWGSEDGRSPPGVEIDVVDAKDDLCQALWLDVPAAMLLPERRG
jgi:hypothetical protein